MSWSWSHTNEAYDNAYHNVQQLTKKDLLVILREWAYYDREQADKTPSFRLTFNGRSSRQEHLAELVWERMSEFAICDGFNAWACPYGCHTVSFDGPKQDNE